MPDNTRVAHIHITFHTPFNDTAFVTHWAGHSTFYKVFVDSLRHLINKLIVRKVRYLNNLVRTSTQRTADGLTCFLDQFNEAQLTIDVATRKCFGVLLTITANAAIEKITVYIVRQRVRDSPRCHGIDIGTVPSL